MNVFIAALDWGLGHATRVIPIIKQQVEQGNQVIIGASKTQKPIYKEHFPSVPLLSMPSNSPVYSKRANQCWALLYYLPKFLWHKRREKRWVYKLVENYNIQLIISDNCYGLYCKKAKSILISHQLNIIVPINNRLITNWVNKQITRWANRFDECHVPDFSPPNNLSGRLSGKPRGLKCKLKYIGPLSRLNLCNSTPPITSPELLILISGPEKQRSVFEEKVLEAIDSQEDIPEYLLVRGLPRNQATQLPNTVNHCNANDLSSLIMGAKYIICRAGYSTIMDLICLGKTALLVPTPGQPEQEYLANHLSKKGLFACATQDHFSIGKALELLDKLSPKPYNSFR